MYWSPFEHNFYLGWILLERYILSSRSSTKWGSSSQIVKLEKLSRTSYIDKFWAGLSWEAVFDKRELFKTVLSTQLNA